MSRNMMNGYPMYPYYGAMRPQNDLLRCTGASGAEQVNLPPETTAAGDVSLQMAKNGIPLQETKRTQTLAVGDSVMATGRSDTWLRAAVRNLHGSSSSSTQREQQPER